MISQDLRTVYEPLALLASWRFNKLSFLSILRKSCQSLIIDREHPKFFQIQNEVAPINTLRPSAFTNKLKHYGMLPTDH
ncbi:hypothetical protein CBP27_07935 [Fischerella thermalis WC542]|uniref:Uncharacterized protein n=1 Tax=Fischerella thermalis JSC-11 TaxID=741277 RepID=G6FZA0_9CYAN|nr:hypothetical protein FJSC11DRAFT_4199 [Fischerella thermalis JSC-11]PLZ08711.1 hypothetical protein CBP18_13345 [Fischerella thermalis WC119]PLZ09665.1 hypothetical protein CBP17_12320 [Fischerella thermalis WC114]PLZ14452.1 hypothetical protein CBP19_08295 [Fischerella thermalis WC1110]PLZ19492.1 hypothetical protein CBP30_14265 [Fischerella thermalis WC157]PLZ29033.1 hypothetical protein CBP29_00695 [Fischerella thermalis WC341]PLZ32020.1 hypothetical protein CBP28_05825 [Fischerella the